MCRDLFGSVADTENKQKRKIGFIKTSQCIHRTAETADKHRKIHNLIDFSIRGYFYYSVHTIFSVFESYLWKKVEKHTQFGS